MTRIFIKTSKDLEDFCNKVISDEKVKEIAYDIETNEPFSDDVWCGLQMSIHGIWVYAGKKHQAYIVHNYSIDYEPLSSLMHLRPVIFHNAKFDIPILERQWIIKYIDDMELHDTMIMSYIDKEDRFSHGLKKLTETILWKDKDDIVKFDAIKDKPVRRNDVNLFVTQEDLDKEYEEKMDEWLINMWNYCMDDCEHTFKLYKHFRKIIEAEPALRRVYEKLEMPFVKVVMDMEKKGITVDNAYLSWLEEEAKKTLDQLEKDIYIEVGRKFDINSPLQLRDILFKERKYTPPADSKTNSGQDSTDSETLRALKETYTCKLCELVLEYREINKLQSTYIKAIPRQTINGRIHCSWNQIGTRTGRLSSSNPNLQNIPRRDDQFNIRHAFKPAPWNKFIICDYSQQELRIMAYFSQDPGLIKAYQDGEDIHTVTAAKMWCSRHIAKTINFWLNYGRTAYGLAKWMWISNEEAEKFIWIYFKSYPKVKEFMTKAVNTVKKYKFIETITKRRRRFDNYNKLQVPKGKDFDSASDDEKRYRKRQMIITNGQIERMATNTIIQGSSADMMKIAMLKLYKVLKNYWAHLVLQIHDEIVVECPEDRAEEVMKIVQTEMVNAVDLKWIPVVAEPKITDVREK
jgi:DNA polymerase-1